MILGKVWRLFSCVFRVNIHVWRNYFVHVAVWETSSKSLYNTLKLITVPVVYMARDVMIFMKATSISRAIGRGEP